MLVSKAFFVIFALCVVHQCLSKPATTENDSSQGRGIMSSIWGWITYPFSWWSSGETAPPVNDQLVGSTTTSPNDKIEIGKHNVTIWCNDQTCTTMKCDKIACRNITCNLYDTNLIGECREYNLIPDEEPTQKPTEAPNNISVSQTPDNIKVSEVTSSSTNPPIDNVTNPITEEHPLELEVVLSSTVDDHNVDQQSQTVKED